MKKISISITFGGTDIVLRMYVLYNGIMFDIVYKLKAYMTIKILTYFKNGFIYI